VERGLRFDLGLLVVPDGAKGLHAAVPEVCGAAGILQRCQWHKREDVPRVFAATASGDVSAQAPGRL
jgi:hypothetical protein